MGKNDDLTRLAGVIDRKGRRKPVLPPGGTAGTIPEDRNTDVTLPEETPASIPEDRKTNVNTPESAPDLIPEDRNTGNQLSAPDSTPAIPEDRKTDTQLLPPDSTPAIPDDRKTNIQPPAPQIQVGGVPPKPWEKVITFEKASLNSGVNGAQIRDNEFQTASHVIFDDATCKKATGRAVLGTQLEGGMPIEGGFRSHDKAGNKKTIIECNGKIKYWSGSAYVDLGAVDVAGDTDGSTAVITGMNDTSDFTVGGFVTVGAGFPGVYSHYQILSKTVSITPNSSTMTLSAVSTSAQSNVTVQEVFTDSVPYDHLNDKDRTIIINGYDEAREFFPTADNTFRRAGVEPFRFYKKVAYFETDETSLIILGSDGSFDTSVFDNTERTGDSKRSLKIIADNGETNSVTLTYATAQDFSQFSNGVVISDDAFLCLSILHRERSYVNELYVDFESSTGNWSRLTIKGTELDPEELRDNQWTKIQAKRSRFTVGAGTTVWTSITKVYFKLKAQTGSTSIYFDNVYFKNPVIEVVRYKKSIDNFEGPTSGTNGWEIPSNGTIFNESSSEKIKEGTKSLKVEITGSVTCTLIKNFAATPIDLDYYTTGVLTQASDEISLQVYVESTANLTSLTKKLFSDTTGGTKFFSKAYTKAAGDFRLTTTGAWSELKTKKKTGGVYFTDNGTASWAAIIREQIEIVTAGSVTLYLDDFCLQEATLILQLSTMESGESGSTLNWVWGPADSGAYYFGKDKVAQGESSIYLQVPKAQTYNVTRTLTGDLSLAKFATDDEVSGTSDIIGYWMYWKSFRAIKTIRLQIDCNGGTWVDYYESILYPEDLAALLNMSGEKETKLSNKSLDIEVAKEDFTRVGVTADKSWATTRAYRFEVTTQEKHEGKVTVYFDNLHMRRKKGLNGIYQWCAVPFRSSGEAGAPSEWSKQITLSGTKALLKLLPTAGVTTDTAYRKFFRKGGNLGITARLDFTIYDNTTTSYISGLSDEQLGEVLSSENIPSGTIRLPVVAKWGPKYKGRYTMYRDPLNLRDLYYSNVDAVHAWSELQVHRFDSELLNVYVEDDVLYCNTKNGVKAISRSLYGATMADFQETGIKKHAMGPWATCPVGEQVAVVSYDGVYIFDGRAHRYISEQVKNYFDSSSYTLSGVVAFYRKNHLYISVISTGGTRTLLDCFIPPVGSLHEGIAWRTSDYVANCFWTLDGIGDNDELYIGDRTGNVYQIASGIASTSTLRTKDFNATDGNPSATMFDDVILYGVQVIQKSTSSSPGVLKLTFYSDQIASLDTIVTSFAGTVGTGGVLDATVVFSSPADAILAGYHATNPTLGAVLIVAGPFTRTILSWNSSTSCEVDSTVTLANGTAITSVQQPITIDTGTLTSVYATSPPGGMVIGIENIIKGSTVGLGIYPVTADKDFEIMAIRMFGEVSPRIRGIEETSG